jgi:hypothetical protein
VLAEPLAFDLAVEAVSAVLGSVTTGSAVPDSVTGSAMTGSVVAGVFVVEVLPELPVVLCALTTTPSATVLVVFEDVLALGDDGVSAPVDVDPVSVSEPAVGDLVGSAVETVSLAGLVPASDELDEVDAPEVPAVLELDEPAEEVSSAAATPDPVAIAVPTPSATARPPTRPM